MRISIVDKIRARLARDEFGFWWKYFTDEERELRQMNVWQLATVIQEAKDKKGMEQNRIVAEHLLNVRLAQIQSKAAWGSGVLGFFGAILGAAISVALTIALQG